MSNLSKNIFVLKFVLVEFVLSIIMIMINRKAMKTEYIFKVMVGASNHGFYTSFEEAVVEFEVLCMKYSGLVSLHRIVKKPWFG